MTRHPNRTRPLPRYGEAPDEGSGVRAKSTRLRSGSLGEGGWVERNARLDLKVQLARVVLSQLPPHESRTRLLRIAILRRDEVLMDELLDLGTHDDAG